MFKPISITAAAPLGFISPVQMEYGQSSSAVSPEADRVCNVVTGVMRQFQDSQALFGIKAKLLSDLPSAVADLHIDEDQEPVSQTAYRNAQQFIRALPDNLPNPTFAIDPDGEISVTWHVSRTRIFSVSISESERIAYAWMDGSNKGHGVDRFRAPVLPDVLASALRTIVANDSITLRAA